MSQLGPKQIHCRGNFVGVRLYRWTSDRYHGFFLDGSVENLRPSQASPVVPVKLNVAVHYDVVPSLCRASGDESNGGAANGNPIGSQATFRKIRIPTFEIRDPHIEDLPYPIVRKDRAGWWKISWLDLAKITIHVIAVHWICRKKFHIATSSCVSDVGICI